MFHHIPSGRTYKNWVNSWFCATARWRSLRGRGREPNRCRMHVRLQLADCIVLISSIFYVFQTNSWGQPVVMCLPSVGAVCTYVVFQHVPADVVR